MKQCLGFDGVASPPLAPRPTPNHSHTDPTHVDTTGIVVVRRGLEVDIDACVGFSFFCVTFMPWMTDGSDENQARYKYPKLEGVSRAFSPFNLSHVSFSA